MKLYYLIIVSDCEYKWEIENKNFFYSLDHRGFMTKRGSLSLRAKS